jgi:repressor of nif and glnA expression
MNGLVILGRIGESVCQLPVAANRVGILLTDGLNPVAAAVEGGAEVINHPMSGVTDFGKLGRSWD